MSDDERREEYSNQMISYHRHEILERVRGAILDFRLLSTELDDEVLEDVFGPPRHGEEVPYGRAGIPYGIAFLIRVTLAAHHRQPEVGIGPMLTPFTDEVERGIEIYLQSQHQLTADIDVTVSPENVQPIDDYWDGLAERSVPIRGRERVEAIRRLSRAGYTTEGILEIIGNAESEDREETDEE